MIIVHNKLVSQYHILKDSNNWVRHTEFEDVIKDMFRLRISPAKMGKFKDNFDFCFVLNNGAVQYMCLGEEKEESKEGGQIATRDIF